MANKGGALENIGMALSGYGSALSGNPMYLQNSMLLRQAQDQRRQQEQQERQQQIGNAAAMSYLRSSGIEGTPATKQFTVQGPAGDAYPAFAGGNRTVGHVRAAVEPRAVDALGMFKHFANGGSPLMNVAAQQAVAQLFPQGFSGTLGEGEVAYQGGKKVAEGPARPTTPVRGVTIGNRLVDPTTGEVMREFPAEQKNEETWAPVTKEMAEALGLNPTGSYQRNTKGQIQVITQPKQDAPTETQSKYAYNAKRVADGLGAVQEVLGKNPKAASSWWLNATTDSAASNFIPLVDTIGRATASPDAQIVRNNLADVIDAVITLGTGAAYTQEQLKAARNSFLPQPGEPAEVKQNKFVKLKGIYEQARANARSAGTDLPDPSAFNALFGVEEGGFVPAIMQGADNDPLGIRGR